jgi:dihydrofolate synthase/folylpolyglutamate synthase
MAFSDESGLEDLPAPRLVGAHQVANAGLAIAACKALGDPRIGPDAHATGVAAADWPARLQPLAAGPYGRRARTRGADLWLDGGHNPHAARALAEALRPILADGRPLVMITGMLANKDARGFFSAFTHLNAEVLTISFEADAAATANDLAAAAQAAGMRARACSGLDAALEDALSAQGVPPHVLICGSLYLAGEVLAASPETWPR